MRTRSLIAFSSLTVAALLLAGCASGEDATNESSGTSTPEASAAAGDLCEGTLDSGAVSDGVTVDGAFGEVSTASFELGQEVDSVERTVVSEGTGDIPSDGDYISYALSAFDMDSGERLGDAGYVAGELLPQALTAGTSLGQMIGCAPVGSRLSVVIPGVEADEDAGTAAVAAQVYVVDVLSIVPTAAWGVAQEPTAGMPEVTLAEDGTPSVTIPDADAPTDLQISVLKEGDGEPVGDGDTTLLQYYGVNWETGETFDASWTNGAPISIDGNTYVEGFTAALAGQKAGSQILVVIPPALGYGEASEENTNELAGQTLVFVIDILATVHPVSS